jgi:voltage-gated potassium channel
MPEHPMSGPAPGRIERREERRRRRFFGLTPRAALGWIAVAALAVATLGALLTFLLDRGAFDSFWDALWWSVVTVGTVGYGDVVPTNGAGRIVASIMIIFTMAFFPILTGVVTAGLIDRGQSEATRSAEGKAAERQAELVRMLRSIDDRLTRLEDRGR